MPRTTRRRDSGYMAFVLELNWCCLVVAAWSVLLSILTLEARGPGGAIIAIFVLPVQLLFGLLPAVWHVSKSRLAGAARRRLLVPAIVGASLSALALAVTAIFFEGGC